MHMQHLSRHQLTQNEKTDRLSPLICKVVISSRIHRNASHSHIQQHSSHSITTRNRNNNQNKRNSNGSGAGVNPKAAGQCRCCYIPQLSPCTSQCSALAACLGIHGTCQSRHARHAWMDLQRCCCAAPSVMAYEDAGGPAWALSSSPGLKR